MNMHENNPKLDKIFKNASPAEISDLNGEYYVDMLTGVLPSIRRFSHRKIFYQEDGKTTGCNIVFKNFKWGYFFLETRNFTSEQQTAINYAIAENSFLTNKIRDHIKCVEPGKLYIGRFNYLLGGKLYFLGYFSLIKK
ncbi:MAG: hypothetical protein V1860_03895 [bacterium]